MKNQWMIGVVSLAAGFGLGYLFTKKQLIKAMDAMVEEETAEAKAYYHDLYMKQVDADVEVEEAAEVLLSMPAETVGALQSYLGVSPSPTLVAEAEKFTAAMEARQEASKPKVPEARVNIVPLKSDIPGEELAEDVPFILSADEFMAGEKNYNQITLTYYSGDQVLADEKDTIVEKRIDETVGLANLEMFGELSGSGDPNVIYIRCNRFMQDFEVVRSMGKYSVEVMGLTEETGE